MATQCAASVKLALPTILHNVFRSEFTCGLHSSPVHRFRRPPRVLHNARLFTSTTPFCQVQTEKPQHVAPESPPARVSEPSSSQTQREADSRASCQEITSAKPADKPKKKPDAAKRTKDRKDARKDKNFDKSKKGLQKKNKHEHWQIQKDALDKKFPAGWSPPKKLSPDALDGIRHLHATAPDQFTTAFLAEEFKISPEAIRRILKSRWRPSEDELESRRKRWEKRHERIWSQMIELGLRPPTETSKPLSDAKTLYRSKK